MRTLACVPIMVEDPGTALDEATHAHLAGADMVELRFDALLDGRPECSERAAELIARCPLPVIATCRPAWEGGEYDGDDRERVAFFERLALADGPGQRPPRYIDVELAAYERSANLRQKVDLVTAHDGQRRPDAPGLILSTHDFDGRPADLSRRLLRMREHRGASVHKIAFRARSVRDNLELFETLASRDRPTIALGMGRFGLASRVLAPKFGGLLTFASLRPRSATAPGQPTIADLLGQYRLRSIGPATRVLGIVGDPVEHSLSPAVHNAQLELDGVDAVYVPLPVAGGYESFKASVLALLHDPRLDLLGLSVTMPHKANLARLAAECGHEADALSSAGGVANTLVRTGEAVRVLNTDGPAIADLAQQALGGLAGEEVLLVGAGGVARAAALALSARGAAVRIANRTRRSAEELAAAVAAQGGRARAIGAATPEDAAACRCLVHCTPVGMAGGPDPGGLACPEAALDALRGGAVVVETVYAPADTPLVRAARARGLAVVDGLAVFVAQAAAQYRAFTGLGASADLFDRTARTAHDRGALDRGGTA